MMASGQLRTALIAATLAALAGCGPAPQQPATALPDFRLYITNEASGDLSVIDPGAGKVIATIPLGKRPRGIRASADGRLLYVALSGSPAAGPGVDESSLPPPDHSADGIGVVDIAAGKLVRMLRGVSDPEQLVVASSGKLYLASEDTGTAVIMDVDGRILAERTVGGEPEGVGITPDRRYVYMTSEEDHQVTIIDTESDEVVATVEVGERPRDVAFSPDGHWAYVTGELDRSLTLIDTRTRKAVRHVTLPVQDWRPMAIVASPDGQRLFITTGRGGMLAELDAATLRLLRSVKVGARPWGLAISPDGTMLYTANGPSNDLTVIDATTMQVVAKVPVGQSPWGVAAVPPAR